MAYKDKDKQREANRLAQARFKAKGITKGTAIGITTEGITDGVLPGAKVVWESEPGAAKKIKELVSGKPELTANGNIRVSKPGDADYEPQCETTRAFVEGRPKTTRFPTHKRGKDIKCFADLPAAARLAVKELSDTDEEFKRRTAIAINYQHQFPDRYHSTGVV